MTNSTQTLIFQATATQAAQQVVALVSATVSMTVTIARATLRYTDVRCRSCTRGLIRLPGIVKVEAHIRGHGYVPESGAISVRCYHCRSYNEVRVAA